MYCSDRSGNGKVWVVLVTCLALRAIHLDLVLDLTADQFLLALRHFKSRRGTQKQPLSDNAPQFKVVDEVLLNTGSSPVNDESVKTYISNAGITWHFIPAYAPWMGGVYESMVGQVKRCLGKSLGSSRLTSVQLQTLLTEVQRAINTRALLYVEADQKSSTLSPADFLHMNTSLGVQITSTDGNEDPDFLPISRPTTADDLLSVWKKGQKLLSEFWNLWKTQYLTSFRESHRARLSNRPSATAPSPTVGDLVQIHDTPSWESWKLGRITKLLPSRDGQVRAAYVQLANKTVIQRPLSTHYPLEYGSELPLGEPQVQPSR